MRAVQVTEFGGPEALRVVELPVPRPAAGEALIRVGRAGVNFADIHQRTGSYVHQAELPFIPGGEVAGVLEPGGERVVALCGSGGYAEYAVAPADAMFPIPDGVGDGQALALLIQGLTAWHLHRSCAHTAVGETVVVHSAAGGVGSLAVQLAAALGAGRVIATASSGEKRSLARSLGADVALDPAPEGLRERLLEANEGQPVDVVFDMAGGRVFDESFDALAPFGRIVVCGIASREQNELRTGRLLRESRSVIGFWLMHCLERPRELVAPALAELFGHLAAGRLRVVEGGTYPLADAARAHADLESRRSSGKLLLDPTA